MVVKGTRRGFWRVPLRGWSELKKVLGCLDQLGGWPCCEQEAEVETCADREAQIMLFKGILSETFGKSIKQVYWLFFNRL